MASIKQVKIGNSTYDIKATYDGSGNTISSTYVKKAGDTMTGNLTIDSKSLIFKENSLTKGTNPSSVLYNTIYFMDKTGGSAAENRLAAVSSGVNTSGASTLYLEAYDFTSGSSAETYIAVTKPKGGYGHASVSHANTSERVLRNIGYGTDAPSGGSAGDVYIQYE